MKQESKSYFSFFLVLTRLTRLTNTLPLRHCLCWTRSSENYCTADTFQRNRRQHWLSPDCNKHAETILPLWWHTSTFSMATCTWEAHV